MSHTPYTSRKLRSDLLRLNPHLHTKLKPVTVNGSVFGCSGFVTDPFTGAVVYVTTDHNHGTRYNRAMYRLAQDTRDYSGGSNHQCTYSELAASIVGLLNKAIPATSRDAAGKATARTRPAPATSTRQQPLSEGLRREYALVHSVLPKGRHPNGGTIWELDLGGGRKVRTASGSGSWAVRMEPEPGRVRRMCLLFNGRGTVSGVERG